MALGILENLYREYELILCNTDKTQLSFIDFTDLNYNTRYDTVDELDFEVSYYQNGHKKEIDKNFDLIKSGYLILMNIKHNDTIIKSQYFTITSISPTENDGIFKKKASCKSLEYIIFSRKLLRGYKDQGSQLLYDSVGTNGIINYMLTSIFNTWTIGTIDSKYNNIYHIFDFDKNTYLDVFYELEKKFNCKITFDTINNKINISDPSTNINTGLILSDTNYVKSLSSEDKLDLLVTRLFVYGKDNISIIKYNPTGRLYIEDYSFFITNGFFSSSLSSAWTNYTNLITSVSGNFTTYINQLEGYESSLLTKENELIGLNAQLKVIEDNMDAQKNSTYKNNATYDALYTLQQNKKNEISSKQSEINALESNITGVNANITSLQNALSYTNNFTSAQLEELTLYIYEDSLELNSVTDEELLYGYAVEYLALKAKLPISVEVDSIDIFDVKEAQFDWNKVQTGNFANINCPELGYDYYPIRLISMSHNPFSNSLSLSFSNTNDLNVELNDLEKMWTKGNQAANTVVVNKDDYGKYAQDKTDILFTGDQIDTDENEIVAGNSLINRRGFIGSDIGSYGAMQLLNDKIIFSKDNWSTFFTLLSGKGLYLETENGLSRIVLTPESVAGKGGFQIDKWNTVSEDWDNILYIDSVTGNYHVDNGFIELNSPYNQIKIDPAVGIIVYNTVADPAVEVFKLDTNGNVFMQDATVQGIFKTGTTGQARIEIDANGLKSYNTSNKKHGLFINPGAFVDLKLYRLDSEFFTIYDGDGISVIFQFETNPKLAINSTGGYGYDTWNFNALQQGGVTVATQTWVNGLGFLTGNGVNGSFTTADGKTVTVSNGLITNIV
jgi:hypothetical protein